MLVMVSVATMRMKVRSRQRRDDAGEPAGALPFQLHLDDLHMLAGFVVPP